MKPKMLLACLLAAICGTLSACGQTAVKDVSMYDLSRAMLAATAFEEMSYASSSDSDPAGLFANVSDLAYSKVSAFFIAYAANAKGNADEVIVIALKNAGHVTEATASLKKHLEDRRRLYATYDPTQSEKLADGIVFSKDNFAVLVVSGDNRKVRQAFETFLQDQ